MSIFDAASFWRYFRHGTAVLNGVRLHYVEGGNGAPILLIPGWPQSWYAWRLVMPLLAAAGRRVIAVDPRGIGDSDRPSSKYDMTTVAAELHGFAEALGLVAALGLDVVGHDIGTWIGYSYASDWPGDVKRLALFDASLPGITPPPAGIPSAEVNVKTWHFAFNRLDDLPEILIQGREREFLTWLFRAKTVKPWAIGPADLDEYVRVFSAPGATRAALFLLSGRVQPGKHRSEPKPRRTQADDARPGLRSRTRRGSSTDRHVASDRKRRPGRRNGRLWSLHARGVSGGNRRRTPPILRSNEQMSCLIRYLKVLARELKETRFPDAGLTCVRATRGELSPRTPRARRRNVA
jgi:pimeloyl-ACP methyl ester carboxylesterase